MNDYQSLLNFFNLSNGLIAFASRPGMGKTSLTLVLANQLAKGKRVLFISYQEEKAFLKKQLINLNGSISDNLIINDSFRYYHWDYGKCLAELIEETQAATVIIDDMEALVYDPENPEGNVPLNDGLLKQLSIVSKVKVQIIINLPLSIWVEQMGGDCRPLYRDLRWSRACGEFCNQIFFLYRPSHYGITHDADGRSIKHQIEILRMKDDMSDRNSFIINDSF